MTSISLGVAALPEHTQKVMKEYLIYRQQQTFSFLLVDEPLCYVDLVVLTSLLLCEKCRHFSAHHTLAEEIHPLFVKYSTAIVWDLSKSGDSQSISFPTFQVIFNSRLINFQQIFLAAFFPSKKKKVKWRLGACTLVNKSAQRRHTCLNTRVAFSFVSKLNQRVLVDTHPLWVLPMVNVYIISCLLSHFILN